MADIEETPGMAVVSVTTDTPHPADESSAPGPYDGLDPERPPVSTTRPDVPIAQSLIAGAGQGDVNTGDTEEVQAQARVAETEKPAAKKTSK